MQNEYTHKICYCLLEEWDGHRLRMLLLLMCAIMMSCLVNLSHALPGDFSSQERSFIKKVKRNSVRHNLLE